MLPAKLMYPMRCTAGATATDRLFDAAFLTPLGKIRIYDAVDAYHDDPVARALTIVIAEGIGSGNFALCNTVNLAAANHICLIGRRIIVPAGMYLGVLCTTATAAGKSIYMQAFFTEYGQEDNLPFVPAC